MKYLGFLQHWDGKLFAEIEARVHEAKVAWVIFRCLWGADVQFKIKRLVFNLLFTTLLLRGSQLLCYQMRLQKNWMVSLRKNVGHF